MKPTREEVSKLVKDYYAKPDNLVGGNLHVVLDDGNIQDYHIELCLKQAEEERDEDGIILAKALLEMSLTQRKKIYLDTIGY